MRSIDLVLGFIVLLAGCQAQEEVSVGDLNHIGSPVDTRVEIDLVEELESDTRFIISYRRVYNYPFKVDTVIQKGEKALNLSLPLEKPVVLKMRIGEKWDHLFVVPGREVKVNYDSSLSSNSKISVSPGSGNEDLIAINSYYDDRFELLELERGIAQAYQQCMRLVNRADLAEVERRYDSLLQIQFQLLEEHRQNLPVWFCEFEKRDINYMSAFFSISVLTGNEEYMGLNNLPPNYKKLINDIKLDDKIGMLTDIYIWLLAKVSYVLYCDKDCVSEDNTRFESFRKAAYTFGEKIKDREIRQIYFAQRLLELYTSSHSYPDSVVRAFEDEVGEPYLSDVQKIKNPSLIGQPAGNFYLSDPEGEFHTLEGLRGKVVLLNFWFVGCKPCEEQIQYEKALAEKMEGEDFVLVNICTNTGEEAWKEYIKEKGMPGLNLYAKGNWGNKLTKSHQVSGFPTYVLVDKDNTVTNDKAPRPSDEELVVQITEKL